jgi:predicted transposase YbfD/YdcC
LFLKMEQAEERGKAIGLIEDHFSGITDARDIRGRLHRLLDVLTISVLAIICGADEFVDMEEFGKSKKAFLSSFLPLKNGIPSHDTFGRIYASISPEEFSACFQRWVQSLCDLDGDVVNIDGKALRRSFDTGTEKSMIYMVSAWANSNNLVLGQTKVDGKSNEIRAIPKLLDSLLLKGSIVTIDAMGTQKNIAGLIIDAEADYVLALKGNQGELKEEVREAFEVLGATKKAVLDKQLSVDHGRVEERDCYAVVAKDFLSASVLEKWQGLETILKIESCVEYKNGKKKGQKEYQERYYISSLKQDAERLNEAVRAHWGIETKLHWVLDVAFREDDSRVRKGNADENFAIARHIAVNKLKNEKSCKRGIKAKRKKAGWDDEYLMKVLAT